MPSTWSARLRDTLFLLAWVTSCASDNPPANTPSPDAGSCAAGFADCDGSPANGCEADLASEAANCGACGHACMGSCTAGECPVVAQAYLKPPHPDAFDLFGGKVAIDGDTAVVGANSEDANQTTVGATGSADDMLSGSGAAYVYVRTGNAWALQAFLKAPNAGADDGFGGAVAISGDTIVVGATGEDSNQTSVTNGATASSDNSLSASGAAYVFVRTGTTWRPQAYLKAPNAGRDDLFGEAVAISGDTIVVGASGEDSDQRGITNSSTASASDVGSNSGAAYVFVRTGTGWAQQAYLKASNAGAVDGFGNRLAIAGDTIVVGAPNEASPQRSVTNGAPGSNDDTAFQAGAAYVFARTGTRWREQAYLKAPNAEGMDQFGNSVAVDGDTIAIGCASEDSNQTTITNGPTASMDESAAGAGAVYVYRRTGEAWAQEAYLKAANAEAGDNYGTSVAVRGDLLVVSATLEDSNQTTITNGATASTDNTAMNSGAVYVYRRAGATWSQRAYLKAPNADANDGFGSFTALGDGTILVGTTGERSNQTTITNGPTASSDNSLTLAGATYVFVY